MKALIPKWVRAMPGYKKDIKWMTFTIHKEFFDVGYGVTSPVKVLAVLLGGANIIATGGDSKGAIIGGLLYAVFCYFFGRYWCKWKVHVAEAETTNIFNPFIGEVRKSKLFKDKK